MSEPPRTYPTPNADLAAVLPDLTELVAQIREKLAFADELPPREESIPAGVPLESLEPLGPDNDDYALAAWKLIEGLDALLRAATAAQAGQPAEARHHLEYADVLPRGACSITGTLLRGFRG